MLDYKVQNLVVRNAKVGKKKCSQVEKIINSSRLMHRENFKK